MSSPVNFHFVDVFADGPLQGNPVVIVEPADTLDVTTMQALAREFNQSETTFILEPSRGEATLRLRSFTPNGSEVLGAGHNALGAWLWWVATGNLGSDARTVELAQEIGDEILPVQITTSPNGATTVAMQQSAPSFGATVQNKFALAAALGLDESDLAPGVVAQVVSTGAGHLLVPLRNREAVDRTAPDARKLTTVLEEVGGEGCYVYSRDPIDPSDAVAYTRFFNPIMGISEDPATGTAAGPLAASLVAAGDIDNGLTVVIEQGFAVGRPSRIRVTVDGSAVSVSGTGLVVASGTLSLLPVLNLG